MIEVTRLNGTKITINPFLVEYMEETPDTIILFNSGNKMVIREKTSEVEDKFSRFLGKSIKYAINQSK
jgi:flagellar protein FlbD